MSTWPGRSPWQHANCTCPPTPPPCSTSRSRSTPSTSPGCGRSGMRVLGYDEVGDDDLLDAHRRGPSFWFQQLDTERPQRNRIHIDVYVPRDHVETRITAALAAGGSIV